MVNIPSGVNIPGSDRAIIDIASKIRAMPSPCGSGSKTIFAVCVAKPKNNQLPLYLPASGTMVEGRLSSMGLTLKTLLGYADSNGIVSFCISDSIFATLGITYQFRVKQYNIDFGNGNSQWSNYQFDEPFMTFEGIIDIPCPVLSPLIGISGFDKLTSSPKIVTPQLNPYFPGYGTVPASGTYEIQFDGHLIGTGKVVNGIVDFLYLKTMLDLLSSFPASKTSATIDLIISMGNCTFKNSTRVNLPSLTPPTPQPLPCTGSFVSPDMNSLLSGITTPPTYLFVPIKLTGDKTSVPVDIYVDGTIVARQPAGFTKFDLIKIIKTYYGSGTPNFTTNHTITIKSTATDCNIPPLSISIPAFAQPVLAQPPVTPAGCDSVITTIDAGYPSHPKEITDFLAPFYVYLRGIREVCKSDPTNPKFITKLPKETPGTITLGNLSTNFRLTNDGIADIDLSKMIDLPSLAGVSLPSVTPITTPIEPITVPITVPITEPITVPITVPITEPITTPKPIIPSGERVRDYCTITPMVTSFTGMDFYDVYHDTLGKIYSGNTYDKAKYKAQQDPRCSSATVEEPSQPIVAKPPPLDINAKVLIRYIEPGVSYYQYSNSIARLPVSNRDYPLIELFDGVNWIDARSSIQPLIGR